MSFVMTPTGYQCVVPQQQHQQAQSPAMQMGVSAQMLPVMQPMQGMAPAVTAQQVIPPHLMQQMMQQMAQQPGQQPHQQFSQQPAQQQQRLHSQQQLLTQSRAPVPLQLAGHFCQQQQQSHSPPTQILAQATPPTPPSTPGGLNNRGKQLQQPPAQPPLPQMISGRGRQARAAAAFRAAAQQAAKSSLPQPPPPPQQPPQLCGLMVRQRQRQQPPTKPPGQAPQQRPTRIGVSPPEVLLAIDSLYDDELKPFGRILRKRLVERTQTDGCREVDINIKELRSVCENCDALDVRDVDGADWAVTRKNREATFVNVYSPEDVYPEELWIAAAEYLDSLDGLSMVLPGGRYSCAQVLRNLNLSFLDGRSLGEICHIVQLSISQKKLLGYFNGTVVPYKHSQSMIKDKNAQCQRPCTGSSRGKVAVATWESVRSCLQTLFEGLKTPGHFLPLSNIKRLFRAQFHIELSETALGYAKLSELLQDPRLQNLCEVKLQGHGYVIIPKNMPVNKLVASECQDEEEVLAGSLDDAVATPDRSHGLRSKRTLRISPLCMEDIASLDSSTPDSGKTSGSGRSPSAPPAASLPRLLGAVRKGKPGIMGLKSDMLSSPKSGLGMHGSQQKNCPDVAPVASKTRARLTPTKSSPGPSARSILNARKPLTPSTLGSFGFSVHNTFIHAEYSAPTPMAADRQSRSLSVPRNQC